MSERNIHWGDLTPADIAMFKNLADEAAERTVRRFSTAMGVDPDDPMRAQKNMQWLDKTRERAEGYHGKIVGGALLIAVVGALQAAWAGFKSILTTGGPMPGAH